MASEEEAVGPTGGGVTGSHEPPHVGVGFQLVSSSRAANTLSPRQLSFFPFKSQVLSGFSNGFCGKDLCLCLCICFMKMYVYVWPEVHFRSHILLELAN